MCSCLKENPPRTSFDPSGSQSGNQGGVNFIILTETKYDRKKNIKDEQTTIFYLFPFTRIYLIDRVVYFILLLIPYSISYFQKNHNTYPTISRVTRKGKEIRGRINQKTTFV